MSDGLCCKESREEGCARQKRKGGPRAHAKACLGCEAPSALCPALHEMLLLPAEKAEKGEAATHHTPASFKIPSSP